MAAIFPTQLQISLLPKWARVAFAARCARRLERVMQMNTFVSGEFDTIVASAIAEAELSAEYGVPSDRLAEVARLADAALESVQELDNILPAMTAAVACWVAKAAQYADQVSATAAFGACEAAQRYGCPPPEVHADFILLHSISTLRQWDDRSPSSLDVLPGLPPSPRETSHPTRPQDLRGTTDQHD